MRFLVRFPALVLSYISSIFPGFSFSGEVREPFPAVIRALEETHLSVTSVDAPSSWNIEDGPPSSGIGSSFMPATLVSLTAPKPLVRHFQGRHFIGGRYVLEQCLFVANCAESTAALWRHRSPRNLTSRSHTMMVLIRLQRFPLVAKSSRYPRRASCTALGVESRDREEMSRTC